MTVRLLLAIPELDRGGPDRVFADLLHNFDRERVQPGVFVVRAEGFHLERLPADVNVIVEAGRRRFHAKYPVTGLIRAARTFKPHVLLTTLRMVQTASAARPFLGGVPHIARVANQVSDQFDDLAQRSRPRAYLTRRLVEASLQVADHVVCQSNRMAVDLRALGCTSAITVIGNGINASSAPPACESPQARLRGTPRLLFVGRLAFQKGVDVLIDSFDLVAPSYPQAVLTLVGEGPDRDMLHARVHQAGLGERVDFVGPQTDPFPFFRDADLIVAPSRYEGFSNTILEGLLCGTPVIATANAGTNEELIRPGFNGDLAEKADPSLVADAIVRQLRRRAPSRDELAADVARRFSSAAVARDYEALVHSVLTTVRRQRAKRRSDGGSKIDAGNLRP